MGLSNGVLMKRNEPVSESERQGLGPGVHAELGKDALYVAPERADADVESGRGPGC